jgi:hypothetical protein
MKLGIATVITDEGIRPGVLANVLEGRGFDSLVVAEHSHIPASRATLYPAGDELPREFLRSYDPFVALTAAALATSKLLIGSGVLMLPQRDSIQTPKAVSPATDIPVSVIVPECVERVVLDAYRQHGVERAFIMLSTKPEMETLQLLDSIAAFTEIYGRAG